MDSIEFRLSAEEVALALNLVGQPEIGHSTMIAQLGPLSQEDARARLLAAGHSLMARGLLTMNAEGSLFLEETLARVARVLSHADFTIRYSRSHQNMDLSLSYHFSKGAIFEHQIEKGVVHHITARQSANDVIKGGLMFLEISQTRPFTCPVVELPNDLLDEIKDDPAPTIIQRRLEHARVPAETCDMLTKDLSNTQYRGSILRVEYDENSTPTSDRGLLVLRGPERLWLLRPSVQEGKRYVTLLPGTEQTLRQEVTAIL